MAKPTRRRLPRSWEAGDADAAVLDPVDAVEPNEQDGEGFEEGRVFQGPGVDRAGAREEADEVRDGGFGCRVVAAEENVGVEGLGGLLE